MGLFLQCCHSVLLPTHPPTHPLSKTETQTTHTHTLTWRQDRVKGVDAKHAQVADGECAAVVLIRGQLLAACTLHQVSPVAGQLVDVNLGGGGGGSRGAQVSARGLA